MTPLELLIAGGILIVVGFLGDYLFLEDKNNTLFQKIKRKIIKEDSYFQKIKWKIIRDKS